MGKGWTETKAPKANSSPIVRMDWRELKPGMVWKIRLFGDVLPNYVYWVKTKDGNRTRTVCNFNREREEFDTSIDDPIGRLVTPRDEKCQPQFAYVAKCLCRLGTKKSDGSEVRLIELKQTVYNAIVELAKKEEWGDPSDPEKGYDLTIEKKKTGALPQNVKYVVTPSRLPTPLTSEELELIEKNDMNLEKLYKTETPAEQLAWLRDNTDYLLKDSDIPADTPSNDSDDDLPFK